MFWVYILRSRVTGRFYTGATADLAQRLAQPSSDQSVSTKHRGPWDLIYHEQFSTWAQAIRRERFFKTGRGRQELRRLMEAARAPSSVG